MLRFARGNVAASNLMRYGASRYGSGGGRPTEQEIQERVIKVVSDFEKVSQPVTPESHFHTDLGLDSLDSVELVMGIEDEFAIQIADEEADNVHSVMDAVKLLVANPHIK